MELFDSTQQLLMGALHGAAARQTALSQNIANANTPGYQRVDVDFHSQLQQAAEQMANADGSDPSTVTSPADLTFSPQAQPSSQMQVDGNSVDIDTENANLAQNGLEYEALVSVMNARNSMIQTALGTR
jgi:flagellar basal-body rod protein FlgB